MKDFYLPYNKRKPDFQYRRALKSILPPKGEYVKNPFQDKGTYTNFTLPPLVFDLSNGIPLITERKIAFWRMFISEVVAFLNGARTLDELRQYGNEKTWPKFWEKWWTSEKCAEFGLPPGDGGPGGYGPSLHDWPTDRGDHFNQIEAVMNQARGFPGLRTHMFTTWRPDMALSPSFGTRNVVVAPCHGTLVKLVIIDGKLTVEHVQRSCDMPLGGVGNIFQWSVFTLMAAHILDLIPHRYIHYFMDAQIYEDQLPWVRKLIRRRPRPFPTLRIVETGITNIFDFREHHFELTDYHPHPAMGDIPATE